MKKLLSLCLSLLLSLVLAIPAAAGSTPAAQPANGVAVQVNGEDVTFPDASPEVTNGRTMVPMRAVLEALGAQVDYDAETKTVTATLGGTVLTHVIGTDRIDVKDGEALTMDTTSYVKSGSTLVPLRFFSQALGYEVYWDGGARTAVVIDRAAAVEEIDRNFTILNALRARQSDGLDPSADLALDMDLSGEIKMLDGSADAALPFSMKMSALYGPEAMNIDGVMDLSALSSLTDGEDEADAETLSPTLEDISFRMICGESVWMQVPALADILQATGVPIPSKDAWMKLDSADMPAMNALETGTMGEMLYEMVAFANAEVPVTIYEDLTRIAQLMTDLMGDNTFTKDGGDYSWKLDEAKSAQLAEAIGETAFSLTMEMDCKADGSSTFSMEMKEDSMVMSLSGTSTGAASSVTCQATVPEVCDITVQCNSTVKASDKAPVAEPPADAAVVDLAELASGQAGVGVIGGADGPTGIFITRAA